MDALITTSAALTMTSREIAELTGKRHAHVVRDIRAYVGAVLQIERGLDPKSLDWDGDEGVQVLGHTPVQGVTLATETNWQNGEKYPIFHLDKSTTLTIIAGYNVTLRKRIIDRWLELERTAAPAVLDVRDIRQLAPLALQLVQVVQEQQRDLEAARPKIAFAEAVGDAEDLQKVHVAAKALRVGPRKLLQFMKDEGILMRDGLPFQHHLDAGRFRVVEVPYTDVDGAKRLRVATRVTARGLTFLQQRLAKARSLQGA